MELLQSCTKPSISYFEHSPTQTGLCHLWCPLRLLQRVNLVHPMRSCFRWLHASSELIPLSRVMIWARSPGTNTAWYRGSDPKFPKPRHGLRTFVILRHFTEVLYDTWTIPVGFLGCSICVQHARLSDSNLGIRHECLTKMLRARQGRLLAHKRSCWQWRHDTETLSTLLALCEGNPPVTSGFPSQRTSNAELSLLLACTNYRTNSRGTSDMRYNGAHVASL